MSKSAAVPFADVNAQTAELRREIDDAIAAVINHGRFIKGPEVTFFEKRFADYSGAAHCIGCSNGTSALHAALVAHGVGPGDEVIIPSHTFIATAESVLQTGAMPVLADIDPESWLLSPAAAEAAITPRTRAIVPVHLYGCPVELQKFCDLAKKFNLLLIEDAAQAHGARYRTKRIGGIGHAATFSFFPGKNLGAFGDAGAVTLNDPRVAAVLRRYVDHGREDKYRHLEVGTNYRLDTIQAAVLGVKLRKLDDWNAARRRLAERYIEHLSEEPFSSVPVQWQSPPAHAEPVFHLFVIRVPERDRVLRDLTERGIGTGIHYPIPVHRQPATEHLGKGPGSLPVTERVANEIISLPMYPHMTMDQVDQVCSALRGAIMSSSTNC